MSFAAVVPCPLPAGSFLAAYRRQGAYVDCYRTGLPAPASQGAFVEAFYTTPVFKLERAILAWAVKRPSTDTQAARLAHGRQQTFSAWHVERQSEQQLLLCDLHGRTRSWLMAVPEVGAGTDCTGLYFGSAVVQAASATTGAAGRSGWSALLAFHRLYSRILLGAAQSRLGAAA